MLNHMIMIRWKPEVSANEVARLAERFRILLGIEGVMEVSVRPNLGISPAELGRGIDSIVIVSMRDVATYEHYVPHPLHRELGAELMSAAGELTIVDYETE